MSKNLPQSIMDENWVVRFLTFSKYRIYRHLLLISIIAIVLFNATPEIKEPAVILAFFLILFYLNMYVLVPKFLFRKKYMLYFLSILMILVLSTAVSLYFFSLYHDIDGLNIPLFIFNTMLLIAASSSIKFFQKWDTDRQIIYNLEKSKISTELEQLKNQINPHFLFNMLNNANVLTQKDPEKASQVLLRLSDLLRYQLYDSTREKVLLTSDIHFLEDFLNLEKIRRDNFSFLISKEGGLSGVQISPLLFISFVENAVKHNNDSAKSSYVNLFFEVKNDELIFECVNSKPLQKAVSQSGGLGLANIKRRLELLFPQNHSLKITDNEETFTVYLSIKL